MSKRLIAAYLALCVVLLIAMSSTPLASAAGQPKCLVANTRTGASYGTLQAAVDAAATGDTLKVKGTCFGTTTIYRSLTISGQSNPAFGRATLDGANLGTVLSIVAAVTVAIDDVTVTHGLADWGGGIINYGGRLSLNGSSSVTANTAIHGGGIANYAFDEGSVTLDDSSSVTANIATETGGGIFNNGYSDTLTLSGTSSVTGNTALHGGGIINYGALALDDTASVAGNTASALGGGIFNIGATTLGGSSSVSDNTAYISGGGVINYGTVSLTAHSTITRNVAGQSGGGIWSTYGSLTISDSSLIFDNSPDNCVPLNTFAGCID